MTAALKLAVQGRGITRLCHLTPFRNLVHIASGSGLYSTQELNESERQAFNQQDLARLDAHPDHICCSIEYPNAWYLRQRQRDADAVARLFPDWVCICIAPHQLWAEGSLFCPRNAAAAGGRMIVGGASGFASLYAQRITGAYNRVYTRDRLPDACPTDDQAEVLVRGNIPLRDVQRVVVADESQAKRTFLGLCQLGLAEDLFEYSICPEFFNPNSLSSLLRSGRRPTEVVWDRRSFANA